MITTKSVFIVFNSKDVQRLAADHTLLTQIDCVISGVPGVALDLLMAKKTVLTLEEALVSLKISRRDISNLASSYSSSILDMDAIGNALRMFDERADESVRLALLNHVALLIHNSFALELLFDALVKNGLKSVWAYRGSSRFRLVERLDIRILMLADHGFWPHLVHLCLDAGVKLNCIGRGDRLATAKKTLRDLLLIGYKGKTLLQRSMRKTKSALTGTCDAVLVVRARTEVMAAEPILRERARRGFQDLLLVDDLIKNPDGTSAASAGSRDWLSLSTFATPGEVVGVFLKCILLRGTAARRGVALLSNTFSGSGFLGRKDVATQVIHTAFASVPELLIHRIQLCRALKQLTPSVMVSFDQVDRWGAIQGEVARQMGLLSIMVQNTAIDDMVYPLPISMDHLVVGYEHLCKVFIKCGANSDRVHSFGLPLHDDVLQAGDARLQELIIRAERRPRKLRVLIATQPFIEEFDYNAALLVDFEAAIQGLDLAVEWIIKPHPREAKGRYAGACEDLISRGHKVKLVDGPFETVLSVADIVVSRTSTGLEFAALGGVPGISHLDRMSEDLIEELDYLKFGVTSKSFSVTELRALLGGYVPEKRAASLRRYAELRSVYLHESFPGKGRATERVVDLMANGISRC